MEPTADELVAALLLNPTLACEVVRELSESTIAGPWEPATGTESGYERVYIRRHISGTSNVATIGRTTASAVWITLDGETDFAGSSVLARVAADAHLIDGGWILSDRGHMAEWKFGTYAWNLRARNSEGTLLAKVRGDEHSGQYELEDFALSTNDRTVRLKSSSFPNVDAAMRAVDEIMIKQGWVKTPTVPSSG